MSERRDGQVACGVLHQDADGNVVPCPGYEFGQHKYTQDPIPGLESLPEPLPQPECASCHSFGPTLVQDTIQGLKERIETDKQCGWSSVMVDASDLSVVLTALERHHQHS